MKNKTKKRAGIVAVALMLTVAIGATAGNTLAKYISSATVESQTATVAAWGYTLKADTTKMFSNQYGEVMSTGSSAKVSNKSTVVSTANTGDNLVAPGTTGTMKFMVNGYAQVNAILTLDFTDIEKYSQVVLSDGAKLNYYPINWYVGDTQVNVKENEDGTTTTVAPTVKDFADAVKAAIDVEGTEVALVGESKVEVFIPAETSLESLDLSITWEWVYEVADGSATPAENVTNIKDTLLGYIADGKEYKDLSDNVKNWLKDNVDDTIEAVVEANKAVTTAKAAVEEAEEALGAPTEYNEAGEVSKAATGAYKVLEDAKADYEEAVKDVADKQDTYDKAAAELAQLEMAGKEAGDEAYNEAAKAKSDANTELATAKVTLAGAEEALAGAEEALAGAEKAVADTEAKLAKAEADVDAAYYNVLAKESSIKVAFGFAATIEQTQYTAVGFKAAHNI